MAGAATHKLQMAVCTATGLPLAWDVATARRHESNFVTPLLDALRARGTSLRRAQWIADTTTIG